MFAKKIVLLSLLLLVAILGMAGYAVIKNYQPAVSESTVRPLLNEFEATVTPPPAEPAAPAQSVRNLTDLNQLIERRITVRATEIREQAADRAYTKDELNFIDNPRKNVIDNLFKDGRINQSEWNLLNK